MNTILLDVSTWDLVEDLSGNIAMASDPYSQAQDAASAIKLFQGELYYDTSKGIPYWVQILGKLPPIALLKTYFVRAALTVPGVVGAVCYISSFKDRRISGQVQIENSLGKIARANF